MSQTKLVQCFNLGKNKVLGLGPSHKLFNNQNKKKGVVKKKKKECKRILIKHVYIEYIHIYSMFLCSNQEEITPLSAQKNILFIHTSRKTQSNLLIKAFPF